MDQLNQGDRADPEQGGTPCARSAYTVDFGREGTVQVTVLDPCVTREARERREAALAEICRELIRRGSV